MNECLDGPIGLVFDPVATGQGGKPRCSDGPRSTGVCGDRSPGPTGRAWTSASSTRCATAEKAVAGEVFVKRNRFIALTGDTKTINRVPGRKQLQCVLSALDCHSSGGS
ncbi:Protein of unknown function [Mycobacterium canettii CIPT 140070017]|nr:Protein of unknown function [Mycobacterium canettii CIPT 140070017]